MDTVHEPTCHERRVGLAKSRFVSLAGNNAVRTLGEEDLFAYLCVHGALHVWNQLKWLADINALLAAASEGSAERLHRAASERGAARPAGQAILLCQKLLQAPLPACFGAKLRKSPRAQWLEATALNTLTLGQGEQDPSRSALRDHTGHAVNDISGSELEVRRS